MTNVRHSLRVFFKQPLFTGIVILTFALGIGANSAVFSVLNAVLLRPLPFREPQNLVALWPYDIRQGPGKVTDWSAVSYPDFADWRAQNQVFQDVTVFGSNTVTLTDGKEATHVQGEAVSAQTFSMLGAQPLLGRTFLPKDDEPGNHVAIFSYGLWQRRFSGDPGVVGRTITLDGRAYEVVGIMPAQFAFPLQRVPVELWTTMAPLHETIDGSAPMTAQRGNDFLDCIARLKSGTPLAQAQANMEAISAALRGQYPDSNAHVGVKVLPLIDAVVGEAHSGLLMLCAMAGCVLLVACVNVANLLLARSLSRQREISIRSALGAGRLHIVRQLVTESALLGMFGGAAGLLMSIWAVDLLKRFLPADIPRIDQVSPDLRVVAFTAVASV
jgi:putative ABC transport system permease protein